MFDRLLLGWIERHETLASIALPQVPRAL